MKNVQFEGVVKKACGIKNVPQRGKSTLTEQPQRPLALATASAQPLAPALYRSVHFSAHSWEIILFKILFRVSAPHSHNAMLFGQSIRSLIRILAPTPFWFLFASNPSESIQQKRHFKRLQIASNAQRMQQTVSEDFFFTQTYTGFSNDDISINNFQTYDSQE